MPDENVNNVLLLVVDNGRQMDTAIRLLPRLTPDKSLPQLSNGPCSVAEKARNRTPRRGVTEQKSGAHRTDVIIPGAIPYLETLINDNQLPLRLSHGHSSTIRATTRQSAQNHTQLFKCLLLYRLVLKLWRTKRTILYNDILTTKRAQERAGTKMGFNPGLAQWTRLLKMAGQCRLEISLSK
nr:hypothetical protein B24P7.200 [imported] - Neurospora crassa [Neurospora crassa]